MAGVGHHRADLQRLAEEKLADAILLARHGRWSNAYYLGGYAIEIGLKACIAKRFREETLPDPELLKNVYVHDLRRLVGSAGLSTDLSRHQAENQRFAANWAAVAEWTEASRYEAADSSACEAFLRAISEPDSGVMEWLKRHW